MEDSEDDAGLVSLALKREALPFELLRVDTRDGFSNGIIDFKPDVILSDHSLPQFNSIDAFKLYQETGINIPFILVTGTVSEEFAVNVIKKGVDDYILKSNLSRLPSAISSAIGKRRAESEKIEAYHKLEVQNAELQKVNKELDNFVYSVSHNLRAPLLSVLGLINLLNAEGQPSSVAQNFINMMERTILQLDRTLKDILQYSHNVHNELSDEAVDFDRIIENCFDHFLHLPHLSRITRQVEVSNEVKFRSDSQRIGILFRNLISNSLNYWDEKKEKPWIKVQVLVDTKQGTIVVADNGVGIDSELIPSVFNMFYRANEKSNGAGLGLYIVKEIVTKLNGKIILESKLNEGTKVSIVIPNIDNDS